MKGDYMSGPVSVFDKLTDEEFQLILDSSQSYRDVVIKVGLSDRSGNFQTLKRNIRQRGLSTEKLDSNRRLSIKKNAERTNRIKKRSELSDILVENSKYTNNHTLKLRLVKEGILEYKCKICGINEWMGKPISLQLDHQNGVHNDCRLENLRLLCPNCHSQTDTYGAKNRKK